MVKSILSAFLSILVLNTFSQEQYTIHSYKLMTIQKSAGRINGNGLYNNGSDQRGGGNVIINDKSFSINLHSNIGDPDLSMRYSSVKTDSEKSVYYCSDSSSLVVFAPIVVSDKRFYQIHLNIEYDYALKLPAKKYVFETYQNISMDVVSKNKSNKESSILSEIESRIFKANEVEIPPTFEVINDEFYRLFESPQELYTIKFTIDANGNLEDCRAVYSARREDYVPLDSIEKYIRFTSPSKVVLDNNEYSVRSIQSLCFEYNVSDKIVLRAKFKKKKGTIKVGTIYINKEEGQEFLDGDYQTVLLEQLSDKKDGSYTLNIFAHTIYGSLRLQTAKGTNYITLNCDNDTKVRFWERVYRSEHTNQTYY
jgi:hypothetical protein